MDDDVSLNSSRSFSVYVLLVTLFCVNLTIANMTASKIVQIPWFPGMALSAADFCYPLSFLITDIVAEIWGKKQARLIVLTGFVCMLFTITFVYLTIWLPGHGFWIAPDNSYGYQSVEDYQRAYESVFSTTYVLIIASLCAYLPAQSWDIFVFHRLKRLTGNRMLWLRNNLSTITSQAIDTGIFILIFHGWGQGLHLDVCFAIFVSVYASKVVFALADTPFFYAANTLIRKFVAAGERREAALCST